MFPLVILIGATLGVQLEARGLGDGSLLPPGEPAGLAETVAPSDSADPGIFDLLEGTWTGRGTLFGRPAEFRMRWTQVLDGRFARLEFENAFPAADSGPPNRVIAAIAFYPLEGSAPRTGWWFDSRGQTVSLAITPGDSLLDVAWEGAGERGRTVYRLSQDGVTVVDSVFPEGGAREFGRATYMRSGAEARRGELRKPATAGARSAFRSPPGRGISPGQSNASEEPSISERSQPWREGRAPPEDA